MLCERYDASDALLADSGTSALVLALSAVVPRGGTVAYPGYACIDLTAAAVRADVRVRLYDLDPSTLSPDLNSVCRALARGVDAIVVAHLFGYPADVERVKDLAARHGVVVIEDAAQAAGGMLHLGRLGSLADISVLSFGRGKGTTAGSGGALLVRTSMLADWARKTRETLPASPRGGRQVVNLFAQWVLSRPDLYRFPASIPALRLGEMVYHRAGTPREMTAAAAAILPAALRTADREVARRRANALALDASMAGTRNFHPVESISGGEPGYLRFACIDNVGDAAARPALGAVRGYPLTLDQHSPLHLHLLPGEKAESGAIFLRDRLFTLPTHSRVSRADLARLASWIAMPTPISPRANSAH